MIKKVWIYILLLAVCGVGIFCSANLIQMLNVKSKIIGSPKTIETILNYTNEFTYDLDLVEFENQGNGTFKAEYIKNAVDFDGSRDNYTLLFNEELVSDVKVTNGEITGIFIKNYFDKNNNNICSNSIYISIVFSAKATTITLTATNDKDNLSYFNTYNSINGAIIKVVTINEIGENYNG